MDNQEAIKTLRELRRETNDSWYEAVYDMAISALEAEPCEDAISRQAAIDAVKAMAVPLYKDPACEDIWERDRTLDSAIDAIRGLPSAQPERKTGHWIKTARWGRVYYCDQCRNYLDFDGVNIGRGSTNFCPNCGAKMDEEGKDD